MHKLNITTYVTFAKHGPNLQSLTRNVYFFSSITNSGVFNFLQQFLEIMCIIWKNIDKFSIT